MKPRLFKIAMAALMPRRGRGTGRASGALDHRRHPERRVPRPDGRQRRVHPDQEHLHRGAGDIGGWQIFGSNASGSAVGSRAKIADGVTLPAGKSFLFMNVQPGTAPAGYSGTSRRPDVHDGIADTGGVQLRNAAGTVIDAVGSTPDGRGLPRGRGARFPTANGNDTFIREAQADTDNNPNDFTGPRRTTPENCGTDCVPPDERPCNPAGTLTPITSIQTLGAQSACNGDNVTVRGIVTGIDNLYGSSYDAIYKGDSGIWIQEANPDPAATTSSAIFVAGIRRAATNPQAVIGSDITITGRAETRSSARSRSSRRASVPPRARARRKSISARRRDDPLHRQRAARREGARPDRGREPGPDQPPVLPRAAGHARDPSGRHRDRRRHHEVP